MLLSVKDRSKRDEEAGRLPKFHEVDANLAASVLASFAGSMAPCPHANFHLFETVLPAQRIDLAGKEYVKV